MLINCNIFVEMAYVVVQGVDMWGGDLEITATY